MSRYTLKNDGSACRFIDGEAVLLNADTSAYYSMNHTGAFVLRELLVSGRVPSEISRTLRERFGASTGDWDDDVHQAIARLESEGLIVQADDENAVLAIEGESDVALPDVYERPALERHGELEQLILSGE
jgi:hypothetical protein